MPREILVRIRNIILNLPDCGKNAILDMDIGSDVDDAFALAFLLASPGYELIGCTTAHLPCPQDLVAFPKPPEADAFVRAFRSC